MIPNLDPLYEQGETVDKGLLDEKIAVLEPKVHVGVSPNTPIREVLQALVEKKQGAALVIENGVLVGIFSERDFVTRIAPRYEVLADRPVSDFMTANPSTLNMNHPIAYALNLMADGGYRHIPILSDQNHPAGILSVREIIRLIDYKWLDGPQY